MIEKYVIIGLGIVVAITLLSILKSIIFRVISIAVVLGLVAWFILR
jgi:hypothetical protein